jgi:hypothetical protein
MAARARSVDSGVAMKGPWTLRSIGIRAGCLATLLAILSVAYFAYLRCNPYDEVAATIRDVPRDTVFLCIVADTPQGVTVMPWYVKKVLPDTMHPDSCTVSFRLSGDTGAHRGNVRWTKAKRIGVLQKTEADTWKIAWFDTLQSEVQRRSLVFGGGTWEVSLRDANEEQDLPAETVQSLGFSYAIRRKK